MRWFRRKPEQTPEEIYIKELNEMAERRESRPPDPYIPMLTDWGIKANEITADKINFGSINAGKLNIPPTLWNHDPTRPIILPEDFRVISHIKPPKLRISMADQVNEEEKLPIPPGWLLLWCPVCLTSIGWTHDDMNTYDFDDWLESQQWLADQVEHDMTRHAAND